MYLLGLIMPFKLPDRSYQYSPITYTQNTYYPCTLIRVNVIKAGFTQTHNSKMHFDMHIYCSSYS